MDPKILDILCCPQTRQALHPADADTILRANRRLSDPISEGLIRQDGRVLYPLRMGIPLLVAEAGIPLSEDLPPQPTPPTDPA